MPCMCGCPRDDHYMGERKCLRCPCRGSCVAPGGCPSCGCRTYREAA